MLSCSSVLGFDTVLPCAIVQSFDTVLYCAIVLGFGTVLPCAIVLGFGTLMFSVINALFVTKKVWHIASSHIRCACGSCNTQPIDRKCFSLSTQSMRRI